MSDRHLRVLRLLAHRRQIALDEHDASAEPVAPPVAYRRRDLAQKAKQTRARVAAAEARRRS